MTGPRPKRPNQQSWVPDQPNGRGYWEAFVWMGVKPNGRPDRRHVERKTKAARDKAVRELERSRDAGKAGKAGRPPTVEQLLTRHLTVVLPARGRAPRTLDDYWSKCRNDIFPRWGGQRIDRLRPEEIEDGYAAMLAEGHKPGHVRKVHAILSSVLEIEARRENISRNPCVLVEPPALEHQEMPSLTLPQGRAVLEAITERPGAARWGVGLACGLRQGEVLGLRWPYADLDAAELRVWYQLQRLTWRHGCGISAGIRSPPFPCGRKRGADCPARSLPPSGVQVAGGLVLREIKERRRKTVPAAAPVVALLKAHKISQNEDRLKAGPAWADHGLVFCQGDGRPIDPRADWEEWQDILKAAGLPAAGVHAMRHAAASVALGEQVGLEVVQELLGHSDIRITRGYAHVSSPRARAGAEALGRALFGAREG